MRKLLISILAVGISAAFIFGATMAWFTSSANVEGVTFTAGTVVIADGVFADLENKDYDNVNPGDTFNPEWTFVNEGTKAVKIRVIPEISFLAKDGETSLSIDVIDDIILPNYWRSEIENEVLVLYYDNEIPGTYGESDSPTDEEIAGRTVKLTFPVTFNGAAMGNAYQGSVLTAGGVVQAIQASHQSEAEGDGGWTWDTAAFPTVEPK